MLILDLDDTIFQTNSINPEIFESAFSIIHNYYHSRETGIPIEKMITALWSQPHDLVFSKYKTPTYIISEFYTQISTINYSTLNIKTFDDYKWIRNNSKRKILVTTGLKELQLAKIKALGIESDFEAIKIDDPRLHPRQHKLDIFKQILKETAIAPKEIWVIGDNPDSEIKAGKQLGMNTVQRKSSSKKSSLFADYEIDSFAELIEILAKK